MKSVVFRPRRNLFSHLRSTMMQDRLNSCLLMHCHKSITDTLDTVKIAKRFACANKLRKGPSGKFELGYALSLVYDKLGLIESKASCQLCFLIFCSIYFFRKRFHGMFSNFCKPEQLHVHVEPRKDRQMFRRPVNRFLVTRHQKQLLKTTYNTV